MGVERAQGKQRKLTMVVVPPPLVSVSRVVVCVVLVVICSPVFQCEAQLLPQEEVDTLKTIATKLQNKYWNVTETSCSDGIGLNVTTPSGMISNVTCNCSFMSGTVCHVTAIQLKGLNLTGIFPDEFGNLTYLTEIDLTRNYINGSLPTTLTQIPLTILSALGNRISGGIPKEFGNISTLEELVLEDNLLEGALEPNIGNLSRLRKLLLSANNFTGTIPESFGNLKNLADFRIDGSTLSGKIPDFIGNWTDITRLDMQGTSMEGPIPSSISLLTNLTELRISDLTGASSNFPDLQGMNMMATLILRNCLLTGSIPVYIGDWIDLKTLDLSDNRLTGQVPDTMGDSFNYMFLSNNSLTGAVPSWVTSSKQYLDLSYNNFNGSPPASCQQSQVNLVSSFSSNGNNSRWCLEKDLPCSGKAQHHSLFINCGGTKVLFEGNQYEEDSSGSLNGQSFFSSSSSSSSSSEKWAYSSTLFYMYEDGGSYTANNPFSMNVSGAQFYETARLSPGSIRYYGLCMMKGSYKVRLHFAEIQYSDDETFSSLGRRIFDVSIQGNQVLKDFNIAEKAGGVGKGIYRDFDDIYVNGSTLEIHLYWSGKGTTAVPYRGVYGPLISAIAVTPNLDVGSAGLSAGAITGIAVASVVLLVLILLILWLTGFLGGSEVEDPGFCRRLILSSAGVLAIGIFSWKVSLFKSEKDPDIEKLMGIHGSLVPRRYRYIELKKMTNSFSEKLGQGGFGAVFKGEIRDVCLVAVKILTESKSSPEEFINEVVSISRTSHVNVITLLGFCYEGKKRALVFEYMPNGSLDKFMYSGKALNMSSSLEWKILYQIAMGIARGLEYLHRGCNTRILHFDIKPQNILLDRYFIPKISDFGLAKLCHGQESAVSIPGMRGTVGFIAPEVVCRNLGRVSHKSDVYSYGMLVLEMVGIRNSDIKVSNSSEMYFPEWIYRNLEPDKDLNLPMNVTEEEEVLARKMIIVSLWCIQTSPSNRPPIAKVIEMLEGSFELLQMPPKPVVSSPTQPSSQHWEMTTSNSNWSLEERILENIEESSNTG